VPGQPGGMARQVPRAPPVRDDALEQTRREDHHREQPRADQRQTRRRRCQPVRHPAAGRCGRLRARPHLAEVDPASKRHETEEPHQQDGHQPSAQPFAGVDRRVAQRTAEAHHRIHEITDRSARREPKRRRKQHHAPPWRLKHRHQDRRRSHRQHAHVPLPEVPRDVGHEVLDPLVDEPFDHLARQRLLRFRQKVGDVGLPLKHQDRAGNLGEAQLVARNARADLAGRRKPVDGEAGAGLREQTAGLGQPIGRRAVRQRHQDHLRIADRQDLRVLPKDRPHTPGGVESCSLVGHTPFSCEWRRAGTARKV